MSEILTYVMGGVLLGKSPILHLSVKIITNSKEYGIK